MEKDAFEDIFGNGSVNIKKISEFKSDVENFRRIDQAVRYTKTKDKEFRIKYLNIVKATKSEYDNKINLWIDSSSFFSYIIAIIAIADLLNELANFIKIEDFGLLVAGILLLIIPGVAFYLIKRAFDKDNKIIKNLVYLENQLESDIEVKNKGNNDEEIKNNEIKSKENNTEESNSAEIENGENNNSENKNYESNNEESGE